MNAIKDFKMTALNQAQGSSKHTAPWDHPGHTPRKLALPGTSRSLTSPFTDLLVLSFSMSGTSSLVSHLDLPQPLPSSSLLAPVYLGSFTPTALTLHYLPGLLAP